MSVRPALPMKKKQDLLCQEVVQRHGRIRMESASSCKRAEELWASSLQGSWHAVANGGCSYPRQSTRRHAWSKGMTLGCMECPRSRWFTPKTAQARGWCQTWSCSSWIPGNCSGAGDAPGVESKWQSGAEGKVQRDKNAIKNKFWSCCASKGRSANTTETCAVQGGCRKKPPSVEQQRGSRTAPSSCKPRQTVSLPHP